MRIGLDAVAIIPGKTGGIETYAVELIRELGRIAHAHEITVFAQPGFRKVVGADESRIEFVPTPSTADTQRDAFLQQLSWLPVAANQHRVDVLHHLKNYACCRTAARQVLTLCDLFPEYFMRTEPDRAGGRNYARTILMSASARLVDHVITISDSSARDICRVSGVPRDRITVTPLAPKRVEENRVSGATREYDISPGYFLALGKAAPYKNLLRLFRAYSRTAINRQLIVAGVPYVARDANTQALAAVAAASNGRIRMLGYVEDDSLPSLYRNARAFVSPSLIEGFGLPALEAATLGTPVAISDIPVHREVMGSACLRFDPFDEDAIASTLKQLDRDDSLCLTLSDAGKRHASGYSWTETARRTLAVYEA